MSSTEALFFWPTTLALALTFFFALLALVFKRPWGQQVASVTAGAALITLTAFGLVRWVGSGHPPFVTLFESMTNAVWFLLVILAVTVGLRRQWSVLIGPVGFVGFLMMGWASSMQGEASPLSASLQNTWLFIHASFATSGAAAFLIGLSLSSLYLMGEERLAGMSSVVSKVPEYKKLPGAILNFVVFGLILWGVMIVSGSIWANAAWGRYWAWDPIELWSLISWLLYGLVLHSRLAFKVSNRAFCWFTIIAALTVVFALWGVSYVYETIHTYG